jgi:transglutaminase-like putative cysteine protease
MGVRQISHGLQRVHGGPQTTQTGPRGSLGETFIPTPSGKIRLRTYTIRNLDERIVHLRKLALAGKKDPAIYEFARRAVNAKCGANWCVPEKDNLAEARALFNAVRKNVRYTSDIAGVDSYQKPGHTLNLRTGDCDDYSTLACAAAGSLGMPCRFKVIRTKDSPTWNHIYAQIGFPRRGPRKWVAFDASVDMPFGWEPPASMVAESRVFNI